MSVAQSLNQQILPWFTNVGFTIRDVNFVFFPKIDFRFEKIYFFSIIEFVRRSLFNATIRGVVLTYCAALAQSL